MLRHTVFLVLLVVVLTFTGCATRNTAQAAQNMPGPNSDSMAREAMFRYLVAQNRLGSQSQPAVYCLGIGRDVNHLKDAAPSTIKSVARTMKRRFVAASQCRAGEHATTADGTPARILYIDTIEQPAKRTFIFLGGDYEGNLGARSSRYHAEYVGKNWLITPMGPPAIS